MAPRHRAGAAVDQCRAELAKALQERLAKIGEPAWIDKSSLWHVRIGPFETKEQAIKVRERLERAGISAIIVTP